MTPDQPSGKPPRISTAQGEALDAAEAGVLLQSKARGETYLHWRIALDEDTTKPVTRTADGLLARGLIRKGAARSDGKTPAELTDAGRAAREAWHAGPGR